MNRMGILLHQKWILLVLVSVTEATIMKNKFSKLKPGQIIRGYAKVKLITRSRQECSLRCLDDKNFFAFQYKKSGSVNCILIQKNCSDVEETIFENDTYNIIYKKAFMGGTRQMNIVPLVSGKVNAALSLDRTKRQWVDLGIHTEACMTRLETCGAAGGAISLWVNVIDCTTGSGIISSQPKGLKGLRFFCGPLVPGFDFFMVSLSDGDITFVFWLFSGWIHIVMNYVGPNNGEEIIMFFDRGQITYPTIKVSNNNSRSDGRIVVGRSFTDTDEEYATMEIDELIYFNQALSYDNIKALYKDV